MIVCGDNYFKINFFLKNGQIFWNEGVKFIKTDNNL